MKYTIELDSIANFNAWAGARPWLEEFKKHPAVIEYLDCYISDEAFYYGEVAPSDADINDFLWFDAYDFLVEAGLIIEEGHNYRYA